MSKIVSKHLCKKLCDLCNNNNNNGTTNVIIYSFINIFTHQAKNVGQSCDNYVGFYK